MTEETWPLWEVFVRANRGMSHVHAGSLHAPYGEIFFLGGHPVGHIHFGQCLSFPDWLQRRAHEQAFDEATAAGLDQCRVTLVVRYVADSLDGS